MTCDLPLHMTLFLESRAITCAPSTLATYRQCLSAFATYLDSRPISAMTIGAYLAQLRGKRAIETARNHRRMIKTCCRWLVEVEHLERDPFVGPGKVPTLPRPRTRRAVYTETEVVRMLQASGPLVWKRAPRKTTRQQWRADGPMAREAAQQRALVLLLLDSAMRAGEVARLVCGQLRADELTIVSKGGHEDVVYITSDTRMALELLAEGRPNDAPLFRGWDGLAATPRSLRTLLRRLARRAEVDLPSRPLHAFRHYAARQWQKAGLPDLTIQQLMRHADIRTTQIYTGLDTYALAAAHAKASPIARLLKAADG